MQAFVKVGRLDLCLYHWYWFHIQFLFIYIGARTSPATATYQYYSSPVTVHQVCAFTALTVRKRKLDKRKSIYEVDFAWIFARNYEGTE